MAKTLKNKDETMTIRVKKATKDRVLALYEKTETTATLASFLGDMVLLGLQVEELVYKAHGSAIQTIADTLVSDTEERSKKVNFGKKAG
ncbi:MAG: hypothetical protein LBU85_08970 [Treponema sp.]|jgi:hypothetical protein|nr:hypothetical protein [Treponema sp.]